ncbi:(2Fe-2S)-binding protein [Brevibacterium sp. Re57]|uniref:(2Fe-2S)-binding protein n=2 Tax=Brevibacteriaceae TaxID=85019 RepID=A0ABR8WRJ2_9MICO|nr:(2Fe-2S)-binding protein [Brevibacterium luteolum]MBD8019513.1 (2Fe-2S)-binding protein [Brevibacterium gallinarum]MBU8579320.1 (2Fe-2S)-binding protein [Brevibacterium luteolum]
MVNGTVHEISVADRRLLSDALRHDIGLTGTHVGCEHGVCGACTIQVDGKPMRSCLMLVVAAEGSDIRTVEGIGNDPEHPSDVQQAFIDCHGLQCGFCTPGFITTIDAFIDENPDPTAEEAREAISGNLCRCTGYQNIVASVLRAAELRRAGSAPEAAAASGTGDGAPGTHGAPGTDGGGQR